MKEVDLPAPNSGTGSGAVVPVRLYVESQTCLDKMPRTFIMRPGENGINEIKTELAPDGTYFVTIDGHTVALN